MSFESPVYTTVTVVTNLVDLLSEQILDIVTIIK